MNSSVAIYGSCVSRDTIHEVESSYSVSGYVARHSLLSWGTDASHWLPAHLDIASSFQRTNILGDVRGDLMGRLDEAILRARVLLWDLVDERHGVYRFPDGTHLTRSIDILAHDQLAGMLTGGTHLRLGSDQHLGAWKHKADMFCDELRRRGALRRLLVIAAPWAEWDSNGESTPSSMGLSASEANRLYEPYYQHLAAIGVRLIAPTRAVADPRHRWGSAPFHYDSATYLGVAASIEDFLRRDSESLRDRAGS